MGEESLEDVDFLELVEKLAEMLKLRHRLRFFILAATFLCLSSIYANQIVINFTFICMTEDGNDTVVMDDGTLRQRYDYSPQEKSWILMAFAIGTMAATLPMNVIATKIGARIMFTCAGIISAAVTGFIPYAAGSSFNLLIALRIIQGAAFAANYVTIGMVVVEWSPLNEVATFVGTLTIYNVASTVVTNPLSATFCETVGWHWSFYTHAVAGAVIFLLWFAFYKDKPSDHGMVSPQELKIIHKNKSAAHVDGSERAVPYWEICKNPAVIVIWTTIFIEITAAMLLLTFMPTYFNRVLHYDVETTGLLSSIISALQIGFRIFYSVASDRLRCASERTKMIGFNFIAFVLAGVCYTFIGLVPWRELAVFLFAGVGLTASANCGSVYKLASYVARQHAHFVISMMQFSKSIALFAGPAMVSFVVTADDDLEGWNKIFIFNGCLLIAIHFLFWIVATDKPAAFTQSAKKGQLAPGELETAYLSAAPVADVDKAAF